MAYAGTRTSPDADTAEGSGRRSQKHGETGHTRSLIEACAPEQTTGLS